MSTNRDFDRIAEAWLAEGPSELADRVLDAALDEVHLTDQRRRVAVPWRTPAMPMPLRLVAAIAIIAVVGYAGLSFLNQRPNVGALPTPSPSASPSAIPTASPTPTLPPIDTSGWPLYTSALNQLSIKHPADWTEEPADHEWTMPADAAWPNNGADKFLSADGSVAVAAWSVAVEPGTTVEDWIAAYCRLNTTPCTGIQARAVPASAEPFDRHEGLLVPFDADVQAFFLNNDRMWVVAIWRGDSDPELAEYGGARRLLEAFALTMCLCAEPVETTSPTP